MSASRSPSTMRVGHADGAHLGLEVVRRDLRARHEQAVLARPGRLAPAVEEVRHVGVLLGLGDVELAPAGVRRPPPRAKAPPRAGTRPRRAGPSRTRSSSPRAGRAARVGRRARSGRSRRTTGRRGHGRAGGRDRPGSSHGRSSRRRGRARRPRRRRSARTNSSFSPAGVAGLDRAEGARCPLAHPVDDRLVAAAPCAPSAGRGPSRSSARRPWRSGRPDGPPRGGARGRR